jgi:midasin (ATPase involved in ribosome maturation)
MYLLPSSAIMYHRVCYSHTRSSLTLLEAVCRCVQMAEPVLLVGETGVGKTATVNYLAQVTGETIGCDALRKAIPHKFGT